MLDVAINHSEELKQKFRSVWFSNQYLCYSNSRQYKEFNSWDRNRFNEELDKHQFVSIKDGEIIAFLEYGTLKGTNYFRDVNVIDFQRKMSMTFYEDLMKVADEFIENTEHKYISAYILFDEPVKKYYYKISRDFNTDVVEPNKRHIQMIIEGFYNKKIEDIFME